MLNSILKKESKNIAEKKDNCYYITITKVTKIRLLKNRINPFNMSDKILCLSTANSKIPFLIYGIYPPAMQQICRSLSMIVHGIYQSNVSKECKKQLKETSNLLKNGRKSLYLLRIFDKNDRLRYISFNNTPTLFDDSENKWMSIGTTNLCNLCDIISKIK